MFNNVNDPLVLFGVEILTLHPRNIGQGQMYSVWGGTFRSIQWL